VIARLIPGVELESVLTNAQQVSEQLSSSVKNESSQTGNSNVIASGVETLPQEATGFDWTEHETSLGGLADGMAALSINPTGTGYMGKSQMKGIEQILNRAGATSSVAPLRVLLPIASDLSAPTTLLRPELGFLNLPSQNLTLSHIHEMSYIDAYFSHYHTTYPFLHEATFRAQYNGTTPQPESLSWFMLLNTVLALGAWCVGNDYINIDDYYYQRLLSVSTQSSVFETGNLTLVQALLLLSNYTQKRNRPNTGWNYLGLAVRIAASLGLHKEFPTWQITPLEREMRRRVWWGLFIFDSGA
jgi:transcriptional regulatory protein GAL4